MSGPNDTAADLFKKQVPASALFFYGELHKQHALRIEAQNLHLEFTDGLYIGTDPDGSLYYNVTSDFSKPGTTTYYKVEAITWKEKYYAVVSFSHNSDFSALYAQFVARDNNQIVTHTSFNGIKQTGTWQPLDISTFPATLQKYSDGPFTFVPGSQGTENYDKKATWTGEGTSLKDIHVAAAKGVMYYKKKGDIELGLYANYSDDRIVFYKSDYLARDFTSYFIPDDDTPVGALQAATPVIMDKVKWTAK